MIFGTSTKNTLILHSFCVWYPNVMFFGALEPPFTCQQENLTNLILVTRHNSKKWRFEGYAP